MPLIIAFGLLAIVHVVLRLDREHRRRMRLRGRKGTRRFIDELKSAGVSDRDIYLANAADSMPETFMLLGWLSLPLIPIIGTAVWIAVDPVSTPARWLWATVDAIIIGTALPVYGHHQTQVERRKADQPELEQRTRSETIAFWASCLVTTAILTVTLAFGFDPENLSLDMAPADAIIRAGIFLAGLWAAYGTSRLGTRIAAMFSSPRFELHADNTTLLYLRSFNDDNIGMYTPMADQDCDTILRTLLWPRISFEEQLSIAQSGNDHGMLITIGRPGERLPRAGAQRSYYDQDNWREGVRLTAFRCRGIILTLGATVSLKWEIEHLKQWHLLPKCLFVIPPCKDQDLPHRLELAFDALDVSPAERAKAARLPIRYLTAFRVRTDGTLQWMFSKSRDWRAYSVITSKASMEETTDGDSMPDDSIPNSSMPNSSIPNDSAPATFDVESAVDDFKTQFSPAQWRRTILAPASVLKAISDSSAAAMALKTGNRPAAVAAYGRLIAQRQATGDTDPDALAYLLWQRFQATDNGRFIDDDFTALVRTLDGILQSQTIKCLWVTANANMPTAMAIYTLWGSMAEFFQRSRTESAAPTRQSTLQSTTPQQPVPPQRLKDWERDARRTQIRAAHRMEDWRLVGEAELHLADLADDYRQMYSESAVALDAARRVGDIRMEGMARSKVAHAMAHFGADSRHGDRWPNEFSHAVDQLMSSGETTAALDAVEQFIRDAWDVHDFDTALDAARLGLRVTPESESERRQRFREYEQWLLGKINDGRRNSPDR